MKRVAFIGLGTMGIAMSHNILKRGFPVVGYDPNPEALAQHKKQGGEVAESPADAAKDADIVITMLPVGSIVKSVLLEQNGVVESLKPNKLIIDMSSISPVETDAIRLELNRRGFRMIDAPVGRTSHFARLAQLLIMAGGVSSDIEEARAVLQCMGSEIEDCGGPGMGVRMKAINNLMSTALNSLTAEILTLAEAYGLSVTKAIEVMSGTPAGKGHMSTSYPNKVLKGDIEADFMLDLAKKDLDLAIDMADRSGVPLSTAKAAATVYDQAQELGYGKKDWTAIYAMYKAQYLASER
jgi:4-hydroxybutyrate dehydrogenase/sulfolactaldehyde 3-reductase